MTWVDMTAETCIGDLSTGLKCKKSVEYKGVMSGSPIRGWPREIYLCREHKDQEILSGMAYRVENISEADYQ